ncbi:hypothetical protein HDV05_001607 [Chytridiales sp. JEL 0842]|nr:hypothetical protein HDV05_001607 [Chytridiales sp. JEL 0842]
MLCAGTCRIFLEDLRMVFNGGGEEGEKEGSVQPLCRAPVVGSGEVERREEILREVEARCALLPGEQCLPWATEDLGTCGFASNPNRTRYFCSQAKDPKPACCNYFEGIQSNGTLPAASPTGSRPTTESPSFSNTEFSLFSLKGVPLIATLCAVGVFVLGILLFILHVVFVRQAKKQGDKSGEEMSGGGRSRIWKAFASNVSDATTLGNGQRGEEGSVDEERGQTRRFSFEASGRQSVEIEGHGISSGNIPGKMDDNGESDVPPQPPVKVNKLRAIPPGWMSSTAHGTQNFAHLEQKADYWKRGPPQPQNDKDIIKPSTSLSAVNRPVILPVSEDAADKILPENPTTETTLVPINPVVEPEDLPTTQTIPPSNTPLADLSSCSHPPTPIEEGFITALDTPPQNPPPTHSPLPPTNLAAPPAPPLPLFPSLRTRVSVPPQPHHPTTTKSSRSSFISTRKPLSGLFRTPSTRSDSLKGWTSGSADESLQVNNVFFVSEAFKGREKDELDLGVGDMVVVCKVYEDGWAVGVNKSTEKLGVFPPSSSSTSARYFAATGVDDEVLVVVSAPASVPLSLGSCGVGVARSGDDDFIRIWCDLVESPELVEDDDDDDDVRGGIGGFNLIWRGGDEDLEIGFEVVLSAMLDGELRAEGREDGAAVEPPDEERRSARSSEGRGRFVARDGGGGGGRCGRSNPEFGFKDALCTLANDVNPDVAGEGFALFCDNGGGGGF